MPTKYEFSKYMNMQSNVFTNKNAIFTYILNRY